MRGSLEWQPGGDERQLAELVERRSSGTLGRLACGNVKFFHDGVVENRTRLDLDEAIAAQTIAAAHACAIEHQTGSIEVGKLADLVVLDRDLHRLAPAEYIAASVVATLVEGDVMYAAADSALSA